MDVAKRGAVVIVTGASSGIGRALAMRLGLLGYRVGLIARRREALESAAAGISRSGGQAVSAVADVSDRSQLRSAVAEIERSLGPSDVMVANEARPHPVRVVVSNSFGFGGSNTSLALRAV